MIVWQPSRARRATRVFLAARFCGDSRVGWMAGIFFLAALPLYTGAALAEVVVTPGEENLRQAIARATPGETLRLLAGRHGAAVIDKSLTLVGAPGATVDGGGQGSALIVTAPHVVVRGLTCVGSGDIETDLNSGILVQQTAAGATIENNQVMGNLYGIAIQGPPNVIVQHNVIANRNDLRLNERGNGINIWNSKGSVFADNRIEGGRDGIYIHTAHGNTIRGNHITGLRFAIHYMYANDNTVSGNVSMGNSVGFALMYSKNLKILNNISLKDRDHGLMFHSSHNSELSGNLVKNTHDKCTFIYTSTHNTIHDNHFEGCEIGIHFTGGAEKNVIYGNAFINNRTQVKYSGMVHYEWSREHRGNYWSDNPAFDLDGDGVADVAYRPNTLMDRVLWSYPLAKLLLSSPVMEILRLAQSQFPSLNPGGVVDSWPLMTPPPLPVALPAHLADKRPQRDAASGS
ncbi:MAG: nitrous oxide reductase family maturation protein NosD [Magnetococcales bacterium]|nr:nitrous oxide reductase family maturation protein NosD [Magnetococcales bacterium]